MGFQAHYGFACPDSAPSAPAPAPAPAAPFSPSAVAGKKHITFIYARDVVLLQPRPQTQPQPRPFCFCSKPDPDHLLLILVVKKMGAPRVPELPGPQLSDRQCPGPQKGMQMGKRFLAMSHLGSSRLESSLGLVLFGLP